MFISKKLFFKYFKIFLVSSQLEKLVLVSSILFFIIFNFIYDIGSNDDFLSIKLENKLGASFLRINSLDDFYDWMENDFYRHFYF